MVGRGAAVLHVIVDGAVVGALALEDGVRPESRRAVERLHDEGVRVGMITGDAWPVARAVGAELGLEVEDLQSNHEGELIDRIHAARGRVDGIIINPGGLTHSSVSLRDALAGVGLPTIEVHLSNLARREPFRQTSLVAGIALGTIAGFGAAGYSLAVRAFWHYFEVSTSPS